VAVAIVAAGLLILTTGLCFVRYRRKIQKPKRKENILLDAYKMIENPNYASQPAVCRSGLGKST